MKCDGLPGWECGRITSGPEGWCLQHGDRAEREARWARAGATKADVDGLYAGRNVVLPVARPHEAQMALFGELA